jgi:hypothetical protein
MTTQTTLVIPNYDEFSDLIAWAGEPAHCNGNAQVEAFLKENLLLHDTYPARIEVPADLATDVEALVSDWEDMMAANNEPTYTTVIVGGDNL